MAGLSGKVALVTGASRGVGNGVALSLGVGYRWYGCCVASIVTILSGCAVGPPPGDSPFDCIGIPGVRGERIALELVAIGLGNPTDIQAPPGEHGRLMVAALEGRIHVISLPGDTVAATPYFDLADTPSGGWNLSGLAFHPDYQQNGHFYINYRRASDNHLVISRFTAPVPSGNADPDNEVILIDLPPPEWDHDGGPLAFCPFDGYLYVAIGDGGPQTDLTDGRPLGDDFDRGQDPTTLRGKLLRLDVDTPSGGNNYGIPADNPWTAADSRGDPVSFRRGPDRAGVDQLHFGRELAGDSDPGGVGVAATGRAG